MDTDMKSFPRVSYPLSTSPLLSLATSTPLLNEGGGGHLAHLIAPSWNPLCPHSQSTSVYKSIPIFFLLSLMYTYAVVPPKPYLRMPKHSLKLYIHTLQILFSSTHKIIQSYLSNIHDISLYNYGSTWYNRNWHLPIPYHATQHTPCG